MTIRALIGLGNPGPAYALQRHNVGFMVLDLLATNYSGLWRTEKNMMTAGITIAGRPILLVKPMTGMNLSGAVIPHLKKSGIGAAEIAIIHDELELPFGSVAVRHQGSARGHNGIRSLIAALGSDVCTRIRVGIGRPEDRAAVPHYVLSPFSEGAAQRDELIARAIALIENTLAQSTP